MTLRIDLNTVPSAMEQLAASWKGNNGGQREVAPKTPPPGHADFPKPPAPVTKYAANVAPRQRPEHVTALNDESRLGREQARIVEAQNNNLRDFLAEPEPDPVVYALELPPLIGLALREAYRCRRSDMAGHWEVPDGPLVPVMLKLGLLMRIGKHQRIMSSFAMKVRRVVMEDVG